MNFLKQRFMNSKYLKNSGVYLLIHGIVAILVGMAFIFATKSLLSTIVQVFGIIMLVLSGVFIFYSFWRNDDKKLNIKYLALIQGILYLTLGVFTLSNSALMLSLIILFFGIWAILAGGFQIFYGQISKNKVWANKTLIFNGLILIIVGLIMTFKQEIFLNFIGKVMGWICILSGLVTFFFSILFYRFSKKIVEDEEILS